MSEYIGKGEKRTARILQKLFPDAEVIPQTPLKSLVPYSSHCTLGKEHARHKFDIGVFGSYRDFVVELNLGHGVIARQKMEVYEEHLKQRNIQMVEIEANECKSLFDENVAVGHVDTWQDWIDVIHALEKAGIEPQ